MEEEKKDQVADKNEEASSTNKVSSPSPMDDNHGEKNDNDSNKNNQDDEPEKENNWGTESADSPDRRRPDYRRSDRREFDRGGRRYGSDHGGYRGDHGGYRYPPREYRRREPFRRGGDKFGNTKEKEEAVVKSKTLFVGGLPFQVDSEEVEEKFNQYGNVHKVKIGQKNGKAAGYAFVEFEDRESAENAYKILKEQFWKGQQLRIDWDIGIEKKQQKLDRIRGESDPPYRRYGHYERGRGRGRFGRSYRDRPMYHHHPYSRPMSPYKRSDRGLSYSPEREGRRRSYSPDKYRRPSFRQGPPPYNNDYPPPMRHNGPPRDIPSGPPPNMPGNDKYFDDRYPPLPDQIRHSPPNFGPPMNHPNDAPRPYYGRRDENPPPFYGGRGSSSNNPPPPYSPPFSPTNAPNDMPPMNRYPPMPNNNRRTPPPPHMQQMHPSPNEHHRRHPSQMDGSKGMMANEPPPYPPQGGNPNMPPQMMHQDYNRNSRPNGPPSDKPLRGGPQYGESFSG